MAGGLELNEVPFNPAVLGFCDQVRARDFMQDTVKEMSCTGRAAQGDRAEVGHRNGITISTKMETNGAPELHLPTFTHPL